MMTNPYSSDFDVMQQLYAALSGMSTGIAMATEPISGQKNVTASGTAEALGTQTLNCGLRVKAKPTNTGLIYVGNDGLGDVDSTTGYILSANEEVVLARVPNLESVYIDSSVSGEGVSFIALVGI